MNPWLISIPLAYLLGSIPFGYLLVRLFRHEDVRTVGSGNIGATNVARAGGKGLAIATLLLDLGKAVAAVLLAFLAARHTGVMNRAQAFDLATAAAIAVVLGHVFPVWLGFRGGKGVASALGVFLALLPLAALGALAVFIAVVLLTRYVSLGSLAAAVALPVIAFAVLLHAPSFIVIAGFLVIPAILILKHSGNIRRLLAGTEPRLGSRVQDPKVSA